MRRLLTVLFLLFTSVAFATPPQHVFFPGPVTNAAGSTGIFQNLQVGPGSVTITGTPGSNSSITGIANLNGQMWANYFPGSDIGAQINNAITALGPLGGVIHVQPGIYLFSTTIQCPLTGDQPIIIQGDGQANAGDSNPNAYKQGTLLAYTGSGDAVNQTLGAAQQNFKGCQLRDLTLDGSQANPTTAIGFHFGGTQWSTLDKVTVSYFRVGIQIDDSNAIVVPGTSPTYQWTERYNFRQVDLFRNYIGMYFHAYGGPTAGQSFGHGYIDVWVNENTALKLDGNAALYDSHIIINGNMEGTDNTTTTMLQIGDTSGVNTQFVYNWFEPLAECQTTSGTCTMVNCGNNDTCAVDMPAGSFPQGFSNTAATGPNSAALTVSMLSSAKFTNPQGSTGIETNGTVFANQGSQRQPAYKPYNGSFNSANNIYNVPQGGHTQVAKDCSGIFSVADREIDGDTAVYICGSNVCTLLGASRGVVWAASSTAPAAGKASVGFDNPSYSYQIYNNTGAAHNFGVTSICSRETE